MTLPSWYASLATSRPDLFRLIYDFNTRPQDWVHPSRTSALPHSKVVDFLTQKGCGRKLLGSWMFGRFGIGPQQTWWDFMEERRRIALLDHGSLQQIALFGGATLRWRQLKSVISREEVQRLKSRLGAEAYTFALQRGPLLKMPRGLQPPPPMPSAAPNSKGPEDLADVVCRDGWSVLVKSMAGESESLLKRFWLKVPTEVLERHSIVKFATETSDDVREANWLFVRKMANEILSDKELQCFA